MLFIYNKYYNVDDNQQRNDEIEKASASSKVSKDIGADWRKYQISLEMQRPELYRLPGAQSIPH
jgi:hypothetical protein